MNFLKRLRQTLADWAFMPESPAITKSRMLAHAQSQRVLATAEALRWASDIAYYDAIITEYTSEEVPE